MKIYPEIIAREDEHLLVCLSECALEKIRQRKTDARNRIVRFGWDYTNPNKWLSDIPSEMMPAPLFEFFRGSSSGFDPDSITINEYLRGQIIYPHIDSEDFGDVAILSLLADVTMRFVSPMGKTQDFSLPRRSLAIMSGELRRKWTHETLPLNADKRFSVVYRKKSLCSNPS